MKEICALIPARSGSKSVFKKNLRKLNDHPLIAYSIQAALSSKMIGRVIVSTNCEEIARAAKHYGAEIPFMRPDKFAKDFSTDMDVLGHFFENINSQDVVYLRPTTPLRDPDVIDAGINEYFSARENCSGMRSMHLNGHPPYKVFRIDDDGYCSGFFEEFNGIKDYTNLPRQTFPESYLPNGYVDICKKDTLAKYNTAFGTKIIPFVTNQVGDIDTEDDLRLVEYQLNSTNHALKQILENFKC